MRSMLNQSPYALLEASYDPRVESPCIVLRETGGAIPSAHSPRSARRVVVDVDHKPRSRESSERRTRVHRDVTSSVNTLKPASTHGPNEVAIATSVASRPRAIKIRPMRGLL